MNMLLWIAEWDNVTHVCAVNDYVRIKKKCSSYLDALCHYYGSSYQGRKAMSAKFLHIRQKVPILVSSKQELLLFPTQDMRESTCTWINYRMVKDVKKLGMYKTRFEFYNGSHISVEMDYRSAQRQIRFCFMFLYQMDLHWNQEIMNVIK